MQPDPFLAWLLTQFGLDATTYRHHALQRRLPACLRSLRVASTAAARAAIERRPALAAIAVNAVLIGVSGFFRDPPVFEQLRGSTLPKLVARRGGLRVCSAGCSSGQELYSVAMLLEACGALEPSWLLGVDCRPEAIAQAAAGWFQPSELEDVPPEFRTRYFERHGSRARISLADRGNIRWEIGSVPGSFMRAAAWDILLFRNLAIYFKPERSAGIWARLTESLRPGGVLVTGKAERPSPDLPLRRVAPCVYEKRSDN